MRRLGDIGDQRAFAAPSDMIKTAIPREERRPQLHNLILGGIVQ